MLKSFFESWAKKTQISITVKQNFEIRSECSSMAHFGTLQLSQF